MVNEEAAHSAVKRKKTSVENSIVVPVFNEGKNVKILVEELIKSLGSMVKSTEIIFVNDNSTDDTLSNIEEMINKGYNVKVETRMNAKGLSSAVVDGFKIASGKNLVCMDGDLQHPPMTVCTMLKALGSGTEFVMATRYYSGTSIYADWSMWRIAISKTAQALAYPISKTSDPMSGLFAMTRNCFDRALKNKVNTRGFKIGLELLIKGEVSKCELKEVEYTFGKRVHGQSKLNPSIMLCYMIDLLLLYMWVLKKKLNLL